MLRIDVATVESKAGSYSDQETPTLTPLVRELIERDKNLNDKFDVLRQAISMLGGDQQSNLAIALLGIDETRGLSKDKRCAACARITHHRSSESFRNSVVAGVKRIDIILNEVTDSLFTLANRHGLAYQVAQHDQPKVYLPSTRRLPGLIVGTVNHRLAQRGRSTDGPIDLEGQELKEILDIDDIVDIPEPN